jgi:hypothetical protein
MTFYLSQKCWGRSCLHLAAAFRGGHWHWHLAGIRREIHLRKRPCVARAGIKVHCSGGL